MSDRETSNFNLLQIQRVCVEIIVKGVFWSMYGVEMISVCIQQLSYLYMN